MAGGSTKAVVEVLRVAPRVVAEAHRGPPPRPRRASPPRGPQPRQHLLRGRRPPAAPGVGAAAAAGVRANRRRHSLSLSPSLLTDFTHSRETGASSWLLTLCLDLDLQLRRPCLDDARRAAPFISSTGQSRSESDGFLATTLPTGPTGTQAPSHPRTRPRRHPLG